MKDFTVVIPTWNSMPELEKTLESFSDAFPRRPKIIVVDKGSTDGTQECAKRYGCKVLTDTKSLGSARLTGVHEAKTKWICFVDSDIILPEDWFKSFIDDWSKDCKNCKECRVGMIFGVTIDLQDKMFEMQIGRLEDNQKPRLIKPGERAWTNNTFVQRALVLCSDIHNVDSWEDWVIAQTVMKYGYYVVRIPVPVVHNHKTVSKWGFIRSGWNAKGMLEVVGLNWYTFKYLNYYLVEGIRTAIKFKDLYYLKWGLITWKEVIQGVLNLKTFSRK